jgi:hypothetical protein
MHPVPNLLPDHTRVKTEESQDHALPTVETSWNEFKLSPSLYQYLSALVVKSDGLDEFRIS